MSTTRARATKTELICPFELVPQEKLDALARLLKNAIDAIEDGTFREESDFSMVAVAMFQVANLGIDDPDYKCSQDRWKECMTEWDLETSSLSLKRLLKGVVVRGDAWDDAKLVVKKRKKKIGKRRLATNTRNAFDDLDNYDKLNVRKDLVEKAQDALDWLRFFVEVAERMGADSKPEGSRLGDAYASALDAIACIEMVIPD